MPQLTLIPIGAKIHYFADYPRFQKPTFTPKSTRRVEG